MAVADSIQWYALRVTYSREMIFKKYCDANNITNFIPLQYKIQDNNGIQTKRLQPVVRNLIFLKTDSELINHLKQKFPIRYIMDRGTGKPIIVPKKQMQDFITVAGNYDQQIVYLNSDELKAKVGAMVRIKDGVFKGVEGQLMKIRNNKRVVVQIKGLMVVATYYIHPSLLEFLE
jgi:Transcription termination factor nusG.